jgi:hypothetical protein
LIANCSEPVERRLFVSGLRTQKSTKALYIRLKTVVVSDVFVADIIGRIAGTVRLHPM